MDLNQKIKQQSLEAVARLKDKNLFGRRSDSFSMRLPGTDEFLWLQDPAAGFQRTSIDEIGVQCRHHAEIYRVRADAGAVLCASTDWSEQLCELKEVPPTLFDEQARHIGELRAPVVAGDLEGLVGAVRSGANIAIYGSQFMGVGMTRDRVVFNVELFKKCATAFLIARSSAMRIRTIPIWVRFIAGRRLRNDQRKAAESYSQGLIPQGMNAY